MPKFFAAVMSLACLISSIGNVDAQDLNAMNDAFNRQLNARMNSQLSGIIQTNMNNPRVQQMYRQHQQQGGQLSFQQFCYEYARTAGFTPQGKQFAANADRANEARLQNSWNQYRDWSANLQRDTTNYRQEVQDRWARQRGENLSGNGTYGGGSNATATTWSLPYTAQTGQTYYDSNSGNTFQMGYNGQYWMNNGQGYWTPIYRQ